MARYDRSSRLAADYHSLFTSETGWKHSRYVPMIVDRSIANPSGHKHMTGKYVVDVVGGPGSLTKATHHLGLRGCVLDTNFGLR